MRTYYSSTDIGIIYSWKVRYARSTNRIPTIDFFIIFCKVKCHSQRIKNVSCERFVEMDEYFFHSLIVVRSHVKVTYLHFGECTQISISVYVLAESKFKWILSWICIKTICPIEVFFRRGNLYGFEALRYFKEPVILEMFCSVEKLLM